MSVHAVDVAVLLLRVGVGVVFVAHGYNHIYGGGKIAGTGRWFENLGMRPGALHAWPREPDRTGRGLAADPRPPDAARGRGGRRHHDRCLGHQPPAQRILHLPSSEGYEYVMTLTLVGAALGGLGAGRLSLDHAAGLFDPPGWIGLAVAAGGGVVGAGSLLLIFWRPIPGGAA